MGRTAACQLASSNPVLDAGCRTAARELREIAQRRAILGEVVSADIGWSLLLWMLVLEETGASISVNSVLEESRVCDDTGARWLAMLAQSGLISFHDSAHKSRAFVSLTVSGREKMVAALNL